MNVKLKTLLNKTQPLNGFIYDTVKLETTNHWGIRKMRIVVTIREHKQRKPICSQCSQPAPVYDHLPTRAWWHVPLWNIPVRMSYTPRRVDCPTCGIKVEAMPWDEGKRTNTRAMMIFLAQWARRLSWRETAKSFGVSWDTVYRSVAWIVAWGLARRDLSGITAIGIDELHVHKGKKADNFATVLYQIDEHCKRLLWIGKRRSARALLGGLKALGMEKFAELRVIVSDMWRPYLKVARKHLSQAVHILDRFHLTALLNQAVDKVRRSENYTLPAHGRRRERLKNTRWLLLKSYAKVRGQARQHLDRVIHSTLKTARAWALKDAFAHFWTYNHPRYAKAFLDTWITRALRSRLPPIRKVANTLRVHEPLILNYFTFKKAFSSAAVEGLNNKVRVITRRSYGFKSFHVLETVLYHTLGKLPEPELTHKFC
jgi:transposase